jgi:UV DNA damage repair endonuclease
MRHVCRRALLVIGLSSGVLPMAAHAEQKVNNVTEPMSQEVLFTPSSL